MFYYKNAYFYSFPDLATNVTIICLDLSLGKRACKLFEMPLDKIKTTLILIGIQIIICFASHEHLTKWNYEALKKKNDIAILDLSFHCYVTSHTYYDNNLLCITIVSQKQNL